MLLDFVFDERYYSELMYDSGVISTQLLVLTLTVTPLTRLATRWRAILPTVRWLSRRRRYFGVASFAYASLHLLFYLRQTGDVDTVLWQTQDIKFAFGWIAFLIFLALAVTSNNRSVAALKHRWKPLHRSVYVAGLFLFLHWYTFDFFLNVLAIWTGLTLLLQCLRFWPGPGSRNARNPSG